ncbi:MAG: alanine--tRNA ligase [Candidatus Aenigmarchaeota archaeon]|nr:alanine--tRNA ligase [Candidatus Aenigmarchaeota archaeon]NIP39944.1 alanine--tRNA ligase [Candidatus Aenigmarchaeota archaeon]NIQ17663.1 alanine--tRNA ligase [Candidatus Aenigmarchaeota archaeon]NIS72851.1 alanine--tRNA ligase [Candidatus Aenigmarchaeota archaeon]
MKSDKEIKKEFLPKFWKNPDRYYATGVLKEEGFVRKICIICKKPFWNTNAERRVCGDPLCSGEGFGFIGKTPAKKEMSYIDVWLKFARMFRKLGYTPIKRYPVVARWNPTMEYTNASISAFQPYVISGEVEPPANPLVIPQFCLRFNDIDNVGVTQSHNTGFVMIGQHSFVPPDKWDLERVFSDIHLWLRKGIGLENSDITYHEDAWAGGGNFGSCMEFFSKGCELGNQVYMLYEQRPSGIKELGIKVLDMGMGQERNAWFTQGCETIYDATFPTVVKKLLSKTGLKIDSDIMRRYIPYAGLLNLDETEDVEKSWKLVAKRVGIDVKDLKDFMVPLSGMYSVAEHARSLLVALADGGLPSNVGGGYNLRMLFRRAKLFVNKHDWPVDIPEVCEWHAHYLKPIFPELVKNLDGLRNILEVEGKKYENTKKKSVRIVKKILKGEVSEKELLKLYDSHGIPPEIIREEFERRGKGIKIPDDFYSRVSELHEKKERVTETEKVEIPFSGIPETKILYYNNYKTLSFEARVLEVSGNFVVLDQTGFYPTSGGQLHDLGSINRERVLDVFKQGGMIVHKMKKGHGMKRGMKVKGEIDWLRRLKLSQQHTATHIVNAAARKVLGKHINQAGAKKTEERSHLDITHYQPVNVRELKEIENAANKIVGRGIKIENMLIPRNVAEKRFGMRIYQGGAVPGRMIRVVNIPRVDVEACGGTHLNNTKEVGKIKLIKTSKIQDGVVRIEFTAGEEVERISGEENEIFEIVLKNLNELVELDGKITDISKQLRECSEFFSVPLKQIGKTVEKFVKEALEDSKILKMSLAKKRVKTLKKACETVFKIWKSQKKELENMRIKRAGSEIRKLLNKAKRERIFEIVDMSRKEMIKTADLIVSSHPKLTVILINKNGDVVGMSKTKDITKELRKFCRKYGGSGGGKGSLAQGKINLSKLKRGKK